MIRKTLGAFTAVTFGWLAGCSAAGPESTGSTTQDLVTDAGVCVQNVLCIQGDHFDNVLCRCVPDVDAGACISGEDGPCGGFTQNPCRCGPGLVCVPNRIPDIPGTCEPNRCCPSGWDMFTCNEENGTTGLNCHNPRLGCPSSLSCGVGCDFQVTGRCPPPQCTTASDCSGPLPQLCEVCPSGGTACAHWACVAGACQVAICP